MRNARIASAALSSIPSSRRTAGSDLKEESFMFMYISFQPIFALVAGILILIIPRLLNYIIALYRIIIGIAGLMRGG